MRSLFFTLLIMLSTVVSAWAGDQETAVRIKDLTHTAMGWAAVILFILAYILVVLEERTHLRKSKPVMLAAGIIWILVGITFERMGTPKAAEVAIKHNILEYSELMLFLLSAMTYINTMEERNVFQALRSWLVGRGFSLRIVFWVTGFLAFVISPIADNLTTALLMGAVVMAVAGDNKKFVALACINIVVAANAGGAYSPFGDITTLMVWQKGKIQFAQFLDIFLPSLVDWLVPAICMSFAVGKQFPNPLKDVVKMKFGAKRIMFLFLLTIVTAVSFHNYLDLPPAAGMMFGLAFLGFFSYYIKVHEDRLYQHDALLGAGGDSQFPRPNNASIQHFDFMRHVSRAEWDTLLFFYGVILCVGGLAQFGYLALVSHHLYTGLGATTANILVGLISSVVDNIPVMYAVLTMNPTMHLGQWLLVTLTAGVGGSLLSIGSAAGVGLMGTARGTYTFGSHLKWTPVIGLGYAASIWVMFMVDSHTFY
ncbi:MAG: sodium:proton antiporter [Deltaproteobacteria bacterium]|nr:sodium:proton antiporter [Deltaproteobacteria bacterium]